METTTRAPLAGDKMNISESSLRVDAFKNVMLEPTTEVESVLSNRIHKAIELDDEDDDCLICYATLYRPVKTECGHSACEACMLHWALAAMDEAPESAELPSNLTVDGIKFRCPTCRTYTTATYDAAQDAGVRKRHPDEYEARETEHAKSLDKLEDESNVQTMLVMIGNSHRKVEPKESPYTGTLCDHEWTFFLKTSRPELIEKVQIVLHQKFREDRLINLRQSPYSTTQISEAYFTVWAGVQLKRGYQFVDEERAVDSCHDLKNDRLPFDWLLDFRGNGSQVNRLVKFKKTEEQAEQLEDDGVDFGALAEFMSESEIEQLKEVRRLKAAARRVEESLEMDEA